MLKSGIPAAQPLRDGALHDDAIFMGWQRTRAGDIFALYTITAAGHPSMGSTVTDKSLLKLNLQIPQTPPQPSK